MTNASLYLRVCDSSGDPFQGNVFVALTSEETGETWRTLRWRRGAKSFAFVDLPLGRYSYKAWTAPQHTLTGTVELVEPGLRQETVRLADRPAHERLELPIGDRLARMRARLRADEATSLVGGLEALSAGRILHALLRDGALVAATTRPPHDLGVGRAAWDFLCASTPGPPGAGAPSSTVVARARFMMMSRCAIANPVIRDGLAPLATIDEAWETVLRVVATIDVPSLDDFFVWAARIHRPEVAALELFLRAWADRYDGMCNMRVVARPPRGGADTIASLPLPDPPAPLTDRASVAASAPLLSEMAHVGGTCLRQVAA